MGLLSNLKYLKREDLLFSAIEGRGVYKDTGLTYSDPLDNGDREIPCQVFENLINGERLYAKTISIQPEDGEDTSEVVKHIFNTTNALSSDILFWPRDVIEYHTDRPYATNFVEEFYSAIVDYRNDNAFDYAVLFSAEDYVESITLGEYMEYLQPLNFENPDVRELIGKLLEYFISLNSQGYIYLDINFDKIRIKANKDIYLDYSSLLFGDLENTRMYKDFYPIEFALPALVAGIVQDADKEMQDYSLSALIFYLCYGRMPYDGGLMDDYRVESDERAHYRKYQKYHEIAIFIFDVVNRSNRIGELESEQEVVKLWNKTPEKIKANFRQSLCRDNAMRQSSAGSVPLEKWLEDLKSVGWI